MPLNATNSSNATSIPAIASIPSSAYTISTNSTSDACLNAIPDIPIFDLYYSKDAKMPSFTTVVTKQAIINGDAAYYSKKPMCDIANVLN